MGALRCFLIALLISQSSYSYIDGALLIHLKNGPEVYLIYDSYKQYPTESNNTQAATLAAAFKNMAESKPNKSILVSYEDPGVYDVGSLLKSQVSHLTPQIPKV